MDDSTPSNSLIEKPPEEKESTSGKDNSCDSPEKYDPYAYLERNGFTSEKFKIELRYMPKYYGMKELKTLLNKKLKLNATKIKIPSKYSLWIYVCFRTDEEKLNAIKVLNNYEWKNCRLKAEEAKPVPDPLVQKRLQNMDESGIDSKKMKLEDHEISEKMKDASTPLWRVPYEEQLTKKVFLINSLLKSYASKLLITNQRVSKWLKNQRTKYNGLPCELLPIRHAEVVDGYRNKCEFTAGINEYTGERTVGFRLSSYTKGSVSVAPIHDALNVPDEMKAAVLAFQNYVQKSDLCVFSPELQTGYWRQLTARFGFKTNQLMLIVGLHPQTMKDSEIEKVKESLKEYFTEGEGKSCNVTSLYVQLIVRTCDSTGHKFEHVFGETHITEKLLGKTFRISPQAFFQVNTNAAEILYNSIVELADLTHEDTLLDVCCGTGSIGICLSDKCGEVLGLEMSSEAIADAQANVAFNEVSNAQFFAGKAEEILSCVAYKATKESIVAIADPPRAGLQHEALVQLRKCEKINKLVYVACNLRGAIKNFVDLGRASSKIFRGEPFLPVKAIPVDLFPYTPHCELIVFFERRSDI